MKTLNYFPLLWLSLLLCWSCSSDDNLPSEKTASIELTSTALSVVQEGGTSEMTFTASAAWTVDVNETRSASWLKVSPMSGNAGIVTLSVVTTSNETYDERNATVTLRCGTVSQSFVVSQKQKDALMITSNKAEVTAAGGRITVEVNANVSFECEVEQAARAWITSATTRGLTTSTLAFDIKENEKMEKREGKILIRSGELVETVTVYQEGNKPTIVLTQDNYIVPSSGEQIKVELKSNVDYEVQLPEVDWLTEVTTKAFSTHTYYFMVAPNETYDARTANIVFFNKAENVSDTVTVAQLQKDAIVVAQNEYTIDANGGNLSFDVNTNVELTVEVVDRWIKQQADTRGLITKSLHFAVEANIGNAKREGTIHIVSGDLKQTIKVVQNSILEQEREILIDFYKATGGDNWTKNDNWCSDKPVGEWHGVTTNQSGYVTYLYLFNNNLVGKFPSILSKLSKLQYLGAAA